MKETTPASRLKGQRGYVIQTQPWPDIIEHYRKHGGLALTPILRLVQSFAASSVSAEIFGATSMFDLLLSDSADFRSGDSTLQICYDSAAQQFKFRHMTFSG